MSASHRTIPSVLALSTAVLLSLSTACTTGDSPHSRASPPPRTLLTAANLMSSSPTGTIDNSAFAMPDGATEPSHSLEGTLRIADAGSVGGLSVLEDSFDYATDVSAAHLPDFSVDLVQHGTHLVPAKRGLQITNNPVWNVAVGLGRVWDEENDGGRSRASLPFALIERDQNCVHNGLMSFVYTDKDVSQLRYQITSETCKYFKFDMWGQLDVGLEHGTVSDAARIRSDLDEELAQRLPTRPVRQLAADFPDLGIDTSAFGAGITPEALSTNGFRYRGVNYVGSCPTRQGDHPYCSEVLLPSYSTAKSAFGTVALLRLAQKFGPSVADELINDHIPETANRQEFDGVTIRDALSMTTGNYDSAAYQEDEGGARMSRFLTAPDYAAKMEAAIGFPRREAPSKTWVYHSSDTFLAVQAMASVLRSHEGERADIFDMVRDEVFVPAHIGPDSQSTVRIGQTVDGAPVGGYGLFWTQDSIAKITDLLGPQRGAVHGQQLLHSGLLDAAMQRDSADNGLGTTADPSLRYNLAIWSRTFDSTHDESFQQPYTVPFMSGFGGISVALIPNGSSYYVFSDAGEFAWQRAVVESRKLDPASG